MLCRTKRELQKLMNTLRNHIENRESIQITIDSSSIGHLHDSILLSKIAIEKYAKESLTKEEISDLREMNLDCYSEMENVIYSIIDKIKENSYVVQKDDTEKGE